MSILDKSRNVSDEWEFGGMESEIRAMFAHQLSLSDTSVSLYNEELHDGARKVMNPEIDSPVIPIHILMRTIRFRTKIQSAVWTIACRLQDLALITMDGIKSSMALWVGYHYLDDLDTDIMDVLQALGCFEFFEKFGSGELAKEHGVNVMADPCGLYICPLVWLSTVIVRGAVVSDLRTIIDRMSCFDELGKLDVAVLDEWWPEGRDIRVNRNTGSVPSRVTGAFCFRLPHGIEYTGSFEAIDTEFERTVQKLEDLHFIIFQLPQNDEIPAEHLSAAYLAERITEGGNISRR